MLDPVSESPTMLGSNQSGMRDRNERLVLTILRQQGALPKAEIAKRTGLSAQTVSVIMRALEGDGLLSRGEKIRGKVGQPSIPMALNPNGAYFFGLKVGRRSVELVLVDFIGRIRDRRRIVYKYPTPSGTMDFVRTSMTAIEGNLSPIQRSRIAGLGVAMPSFLWEWAAAIGVHESEMEAWRTFDLRAEIEKISDIPVYLGNDATCACGSELVFGPTEKPQNFLYFYLAYFIGGGVVLNDKLFLGTSGNAGAIGPFPITANNATDTNQLMDVASLLGLEKQLVRAGEDTAKMWANPEAWEVEPHFVDRWMKEAIPAISHTILAAISLIDFPAIVIDGAMPTSVREAIVDGVRTTLPTLNLSGLIAPDVISGSIGNDARSLGAASLPLSKKFMSEA